MAPHTRTSNRDTDSKVHFSKRVPRQVHFPHRKKIVRQPDSPEKVEVKKQQESLPEKMRKQNINVTKESKEGEFHKGSTFQEVANEETPETTILDSGKGRKRKSTHVQEGSDTCKEPIITSPNHRKRTTASKVRKSSRAHKAGSGTEVVGGLSRTLRRQSTMTQLADGRRPSLGFNEPNFKPIKRRSRVSWGGSGTNKKSDKQQRTLTQMIPNMRHLNKAELDELSDIDAGLEEDQINTDRVSQSLAEQGLLQVDAPSQGTTLVQFFTGNTIGSSNLQEDGEYDLPIAVHEQPSVVVQSTKNNAEDDDQDDYQPTQFIEAPSYSTRERSWIMAKRKCPSRSDDSRRPAKSRFSLLSTPEKRQVFEIPSSQSPTESVLSTQTSPHKSHKSALTERSNNVTVIAETPSKRRQVNLQGSTVQPAPPTRLKRFESTVQDSEDEEGSDIEDGSAEQKRLDGAVQGRHGQAIGFDTQAVLNRIDQACANTNKDLLLDNQESSEGTEEPAARRRAYEPSPELGESWAPVMYDDDEPEYQSYQPMRSAIKSQSLLAVESGDATSRASLPMLGFTKNPHPKVATDDIDLHTPAINIPSTPPVVQFESDDDLLSIPMVIKYDSSDDDELKPGFKLTPPRTVTYAAQQPLSVSVYQSADLDGEPFHVRPSPTANRETQQSHPSKAEQQLQDEWLSHSQHVHARVPNAPRMHAAADAYSYDATSRLPRAGVLAASSTHTQHSQATTFDEVTPSKNRTQCAVSSNTTPHRISELQPFVSPEKPPSLFIPSSYPSPSRATMEGWSSPVVGRTQSLYGSSQVLGSLEDFSIPLPPPVEDD